MLVADEVAPHCWFPKSIEAGFQAAQQATKASAKLAARLLAWLYLNMRGLAWVHSLSPSASGGRCATLLHGIMPVMPLKQSRGHVTRRFTFFSTVPLSVREREVLRRICSDPHPSAACMRDSWAGPERSAFLAILGAPGIATRSKDATRGSWPYY